MKRTLATAALVLGLGTAAALAQQTAPVQTTPPPARAPGAVVPPAPAPGQMWYTQAGTEWRASKLIGTGVSNAAGERIGEINELVIGNDGRIQAVVLGVGGFLGIGEREVAVNYGALNMTRDGSGNAVVTVNATRDMLQAAPRWTWRSASN